MFRAAHETGVTSGLFTAGITCAVFAMDDGIMATATSTGVNLAATKGTEVCEQNGQYSNRSIQSADHFCGNQTEFAGGGPCALADDK